eukprot:CAMPEP_0180566934 /NCGR_PEP_ID=MMETSP1037_2-20121125/6337_1 /TAXON_ID=632150 /ORGANISM="Azadinium spinosum, Strain 3D9" /LENGTH=349 /DNA_ID=CAMNT_0022583991 /DNA_START=71 /DNA_END=1121 /DNA_ORIENTATION=+
MAQHDWKRSLQVVLILIDISTLLLSYALPAPHGVLKWFMFLYLLWGCALNYVAAFVGGRFAIAATCVSLLGSYHYWFLPGNSSDFTAHFLGSVAQLQMAASGIRTKTTTLTPSLGVVAGVITIFGAGFVLSTKPWTLENLSHVAWYTLMALIILVLAVKGIMQRRERLGKHSAKSETSSSLVFLESALWVALGIMFYGHHHITGPRTSGQTKVLAHQWLGYMFITIGIVMFTRFGVSAAFPDNNSLHDMMLKFEGFVRMLPGVWMARMTYSFYLCDIGGLHDYMRTESAQKMDGFALGAAASLAMSAVCMVVSCGAPSQEPCAQGASAIGSKTNSAGQVEGEESHELCA